MGRLTRFAAVGAGALVGGLLLTTPAFAAVDDSFSAVASNSTCDRAGEAKFYDYGDGVPGGAMNDDYMRVADLCPDSDAVRAKVWVDGVYQGQKVNGDYRTSVFWDPFPNVYPGEKVTIEVCLLDGSRAYGCRFATHTSVDG